VRKSSSDLKPGPRAAPTGAARDGTRLAYALCGRGVGDDLIALSRRVQAR
jgi:hypothetical protein